MSSKRSEMVSFRAETGLVERFRRRVRLGARSAYLEMLLRWAMTSEEADDGERRKRYHDYRTAYANGFSAGVAAARDDALSPQNLEAMCRAQLDAAVQNTAAGPEHNRNINTAERTPMGRKDHPMQSSEPERVRTDAKQDTNRGKEQSPSPGSRASNIVTGSDPPPPARGPVPNRRS